MISRFLITMAIAACSVSAVGQGVAWSVGTDPTMWLSGWKHIQLGAQLHPEVSLTGGVGWMSSERGSTAILGGQRPTSFDAAFSGSLGLRLHPTSKPGSRLQGLVGLDCRYEVFSRRSVPSPSGDVEGPIGLQQYSRSDLRLLAGGRMRVAPRVTLSAHMGVGYCTQPQSLPSQQYGTSQKGARLFGVELLFWI
jgi:hypothetical protein